MAAPACPTCGSTDVVRIAYGFPSAEMFDAAREGSITLGGCVLPDGDGWVDRWHCRSCAAD
jgi:hypothetical protein